MSYFQDRRRSGGFVALIIILMIVAAVLGGLFSIYLATNFGMLGQAEGQTHQSGDGGNQLANIISWDTETSQVSAVAEKVSDAVVGVTNIAAANSFRYGAMDMEPGAGSGVIISDDGYIVTNNHVVSGAKKLIVSLADGRELEAKLIAADSITDLAVIKIEANDLTAIEFGDSGQVLVGELAIAIGNPGGELFARSVTAGVVSGLNRIIMTNEGQQSSLIQTDAAINPGNSGGALVNGKGELIGINTVKISSTEYEGMGFAIPSNTVRDITNDLIQYQKVIRPALGVAIVGYITEQDAKYYGFSVDYGVMVVPTAGGQAQKAGMKAYDIIIAVDGQKVEDSIQLQELIFSKKVGEQVTVTVVRDNAQKDYTVTLGELS
jgi:serine protease Do